MGHWLQSLPEAAGQQETTDTVWWLDRGLPGNRYEQNSSYIESLINFFYYPQFLFFLILLDLAKPKGNTKTQRRRERDLALYSLTDLWTHFGNCTQIRRRHAHTGVTVATPGRVTRDGELVETRMTGSCDLFHLLQETGLFCRLEVTHEQRVWCVQ